MSEWNKKKKKPIISVIMGVYNIADKEMARKAIQSMLNQSFKDFEFIICDDGSTNDSIDFLRKMALLDERIKILRNKKNCGLAYSLNHCLRFSKGEYVARMDIDDISYGKRLELELDFLEKNPQYAVVGTWSDLFTDNENQVWGIRKHVEIPQKKDFLWGPPIIHATVLMKKSVLEVVGGYKVQWDTVRAEDYELFMRLFSAGFKIYNLPVSLYKIREDREAYKRRSYRHRIEEAHVRFVGFRQLNLYPVCIPYVLKPFIVGIIPQTILKRLRKEEINANKRGGK